MVAIGIQSIALESDLDTALRSVMGTVLAGDGLERLLVSDVRSIALGADSLFAAAASFCKGVFWGAPYPGEQAVRRKLRSANG